MTAHTPTPWKVEPLQQKIHGYDNWNSYTVRHDRTNVHIATVGDVDRYYEDNNEANARLIAAAPDLLAALEFCHTRLFNYQAGMDEIRDPEITRQLNEVAIVAARIAIAKAKG